MRTGQLAEPDLPVNGPRRTLLRPPPSDKRWGVPLWRLALLLTVLAVGSSACEKTASRKAPPAPTPARDFRSAPVDKAIDAASKLVRTRGFTRDGRDWRGFAVQHETQIMELPMQAGTCYVIIAAGSSALQELDLRVFDGDGAEVVTDNQSGGHAAVHYCPPQSGTDYIGVRATTGNGLFAVRRFRGPTGLDVRVDDLFPQTQAPVPAEAKTP